MSDPLILLASASRLLPLAKAALKPGSRLNAERKAGRTPVSSDLLDSNLDQTLDRLRGGSIDDSWWQNILNRVGQEYIAPEFLKTPALQEWLAQARTAEDLKALARAIIMGVDGEDSQIRERLAQSYSDRTGEVHQFAEGCIDVAVGILVAGYIASIPSDQRPVAGMIQELSGDLHQRFDQLQGARLAAPTDSVTQKAHTDHAEEELAKILLLRAFDPVRCRRHSQELFLRVCSGDLMAADEPIKTKVRYWTARLCATDAETLDFARQRRKEIGETDPEKDLSILDSLLAESDGDTDDALRLLRDSDDPDSRTVLFGLLTRLRGEGGALAWYADQAAPEDGAFFTAVGWRNWGVCMAKAGQWEEAALRIRGLESHWHGMPALVVLEGIINAALLLPGEYREMALDAPPLYRGIRRSVGKDAENHHARAATCFEFAEGLLADVADDNLSHFVAEWRLWLRLMDPKAENANLAREEIRQRMDQGTRGVDVVPFGYAFDIPHDGRHLRTYLEYRKHLGGLNDEELLAECLLAEQSMSPHDLVRYLEQHKRRLAGVMPVPFATAMHVDALVRDGQTERARALVRERAADLGETFSKALIVEIEAHKGHDPRKELEDLYEQKDSLNSLLGLVAHLKMVDDRAALLPLVRDLFTRQRTIETAHDIVRCLSGPSSVGHESIIEFLDANPDLLEQSDHLKAAKAWALYHVGRLQDSRTLNNLLLNQRTDEEDLHLDINIAVSSGDWERLATIVDREWPRRDSHGAETLMTLAQVAGQQTQDANRALQLARLAAEKAPDDPRILTSAYFWHFRLEREGEANPDWIGRASELSSADEGPLWRVTLRDLVTEWLPRRQEHLREVERKLFNGEIPISLAASGFNMSLGRLFLTVTGRNADEFDRRGRAMLPIIAGARKPVDSQEDWTIGLDVTSVMVLAYLGLLEPAIEAFHHTKLAPETLECLFLERDKARFHQPSRITLAKRMRELQVRGWLKAADHLARPPDEIVAEVGVELATLLHTARQENARVICVLPISKVGSLAEEPANTSKYDDLIDSTVDLCTLLHDRGKIAAADFHRAKSFLNSHGQTGRVNLPPSIIDGPFYVDRVALDYLQNADILKPMAAAGVDIRVHPTVFEEMNAFIDEGDAGNELANQIEGIRRTLRKAVDAGTVSFLPRAASQDERHQRDEVLFQATASLLGGGAACGALCVDDRYINGAPALAVSAEESVPIICVLDLLRHLQSRGCISVVDHWTARHRLRQGGFAFIPIEPDELLHWLKAARFNNGQLTESVELRIIRQTMAHADSLDLTNPAEALALTTNVTTTCRQVIVDLWEDTGLTTERTVRLSGWVWRNLATMASPAGRRLLADGYGDWVRKIVSMRLGSLFLPMTIQSQDRRAEYARWLEQSVLQRLQPANSDTIETALFSVPEAVATLDADQELYGHLFLDQLPEAARRRVVTRNAEFANRCGFTVRRTFEIGPGVGLVTSELFATAKEVLATKEKRSVRDIAGKDVLIDFDEEGRNVVVKWSDAQAGSHEVQIPDLTLLSPSGEARVAALRDVMERLGPTATDFRPLLEDIESREMTRQELNAIFDESANGVAALQARLVGRIQGGSGFMATGVVPPSVSYFERFVGPCPVTREPEVYLHEVLVPYRTALLDRHLSTGLDICCLGAVRDDLMPGPWVGSVDDDAVWEALSSCQAKDNPFSLLAALDLALYRQGEPRFREFAADAVATLTAENFGKREGPDTYRLLHVLAEFVLNRINLVEGGAKYPGYWKRMSAWMQAGLVARTLIASSSSIDIDNIQEWTRGNMVLGGVYAGLLDARTEPMFFASRITPRALWSEIVGRLHILRLRHEGQGRQVPRSEEIDSVLARSDNPEQTVLLGFPGPLEGHRRPAEPLPQDLSEGLGEAWAGSSKLFALQQLVTVSQLFALGESTLERAREVVKTIGENTGDTDQEENLKCLELASVVAAATRDAMLADRIADAVIRLVPKISKVEEIATILQITLQAAAAFEAHDAWFNWLEERFTSIATNLPPPPNESLDVFLGHLGEIGLILPIESWFHIRARSVALAGAT